MVSMYVLFSGFLLDLQVGFENFLLSYKLLILLQI